MNKFPEQVAEFNKEVLKITRPSVITLGFANFEEGKRCLDEESTEFMDAVKAGDIVKAVDALIDQQYFALGILYKMGLTADQIERCMSVVHQANMLKKKGIVVRQGVEHHTDAVKPEGWTPPEKRIKRILGL